MGKQLVIKDADFSQNAIGNTKYLTNLYPLGYFSDNALFEAYWGSNILFCLSSSFEEPVAGKTIYGIIIRPVKYTGSTGEEINSIKIEFGICDVDCSNAVPITVETIPSNSKYYFNTPIQIPQNKTFYFKFIKEATDNYQYGVALIRTTSEYYSEVKDSGVNSGYSYIYQGQFTDTKGIPRLDFIM